MKWFEPGTSIPAPENVQLLILSVVHSPRLSIFFMVQQVYSGSFPICRDHLVLVASTCSQITEVHCTLFFRFNSRNRAIHSRTFAFLFAHRAFLRELFFLFFSLLWTLTFTAGINCASAWCRGCEVNFACCSRPSGSFIYSNLQERVHLRDQWTNLERHELETRRRRESSFLLNYTRQRVPSFLLTERILKGSVF